MDWNNVDDATKKIPYTKVCIWDGGNTFWAYLQTAIITDGKGELIWNVVTPEGYGKCIPLYWIKITEPC